MTAICKAIVDVTKTRYELKDKNKPKVKLNFLSVVFKQKNKIIHWTELKNIEVVTKESNKINTFEKRIDKFGFGIPGDDTLLKGELRILLVKEIHKITASSCFHCERYDHKNLKYKPLVTNKVITRFFSKLAIRIVFRSLDNLKQTFLLPLYWNYVKL